MQYLANVHTIHPICWWGFISNFVRVVALGDTSAESLFGPDANEIRIKTNMWENKHKKVITARVVMYAAKDCVATACTYRIDWKTGGNKAILIPDLVITVYFLFHSTIWRHFKITCKRRLLICQVMYIYNGTCTSIGSALRSLEARVQNKKWKHRTRQCKWIENIMAPSSSRQMEEEQGQSYWRS